MNEWINEWIGEWTVEWINLSIHGGTLINEVNFIKGGVKNVNKCLKLRKRENWMSYAEDTIEHWLCANYLLWYARQWSICRFPRHWRAWDLSELKMRRTIDLRNVVWFVIQTIIHKLNNAHNTGLICQPFETYKITIQAVLIM